MSSSAISTEQYIFAGVLVVLLRSFRNSTRSASGSPSATADQKWRDHIVDRLLRALAPLAGSIPDDALVRLDADQHRVPLQDGALAPVVVELDRRLERIGK